MSTGAAKVHLQAVRQTCERMRQRIPYLLGVKSEHVEDLLRELSRIDKALRRAGRELSGMADPQSDAARRMPRCGDQLDLGDHP